MVRNQGKKRAIITAGAILLVLLAVIGTVAIIRAVKPGKSDPYKQAETTEATNDSINSDAPQTPANEPATETQPENDADTQSALDPETVATIEIQPMSIVVSYVKGVGGFEYAVNRTASGTQYVAFSSPELVGTKCTGDTGEFATILANPGSDESATITTSTTVDDTKYGLSLTAANCTKNPELLKSYQASFSDAFSLLKKME